MKTPEKTNFSTAAWIRPSLLLVLFLLIGIKSGWAQTILASEGFNNSLTLFTQSGTVTGVFLSGNSGATDAPSNSPLAVEGTHAFGKPDGVSGSVVITTGNISTVGYSSVIMEFRLAAFGLAGSTGLENVDAVIVAISANGGSSYTTINTINGNNNTCNWTYSATGVASAVYPNPSTSAPAGGGTRTADGYSTVRITNLPAINNLRVRITLQDDQTAERWMIDDFKITGSNPVVITSNGFNNSSNGSNSMGNVTYSSGAYFNGSSDNGDSPSNSAFFVEGTYSRGANNTTATITSSNNIVTTGYSNITLSLRLAAFSYNSTSNGMENNDVVGIAISTNSGGSYSTILTVTGCCSNSSNSRWPFSATGIAATSYPTTATFAAGSGLQTGTGGYSTMIITDLPATSSLRVRITMDNSSTSELWLVDDFKIVGELLPSLNVTSSSMSFGDQFVLTNSSEQSFNLSGINLINPPGNITVKAPSDNFKVSTTSGSGYADSVQIAFSTATLNATPVYVIFTPQTPAVKSGNISFSGGGVSSPPTVALSGTGVYSTESDIAATGIYSYSANIPYEQFQLDSALTSDSSVGVFGLTIRDGAGSADADTLPTILTSLTISTGGSTAIRTAALFDGTTQLAEVAVNGATSFSFSSASLIVAPDDNFKSFELRVTYQSTVTDNEQITFSVTAATAGVNGSTFAAPDAGGAISSSVAIGADDNRIEVTADRLGFFTKPTNTGVGQTMSTVRVEAMDVLNNRDLDYVGDDTLSSTGTLTGDPVITTFSAGIASYNSLVHSAPGTGLTLDAQSGNLISATSTAFNIVYLSAASDKFRSKQTGSWDQPSTWQSFSALANDWIDATIAPNSSADTITILNTHTVTIASNINIDQTIIEAGGEVILANGVTLTISDGAGTDLDIFGNFRNGIGTSNGAGGNINQSGGSTMVFENGGTYQHGFTNNSGTIPTASWLTGSTCEIVGYTTYSNNPPGYNQNFYNFTWNCQNQTATVSLGGIMTTVNGDLSVLSTGSSGQFRLTNSGSETCNVSGNFIQSGGTFYMVGTTATVNLNIAGNFSLSSGTFTMVGGSGTANLNVAGNFSHTAGTINETSNGTATITFNGNGTPQLYTSGGTLSNTIYFVVSGATGAFLQMGTGANPSIISNGSNGTFNLQAGATLGITSVDGISTSGTIGNIQIGGSRTFNTSANYVYNGTSPQIKGNGLVTANNLTIDNPAGVSFSSSGATVDNTLTLTNGNLNIKTFDLTLAATATAVAGNPGFSASNMIVADTSGRVIRLASNAVEASYFFPIGDATGTAQYSPISLNFNFGTFGGTSSVSVNLKNAKHPNNSSSNHFITRYWNLDQTGIAPFSCDVSATYADADITGDESQIIAAKWDGSWQTFDPADAPSNSLSATGITSFSDFTGISSPSVTISANPNDTVCQNAPLTLSTNITGAFQWSDGLGSGSTASPSTALAGNQTYHVTTTDENGLSGSDSITVVVLSSPVCEITGADSICRGGSTMFTATGGTSYSWSGPGGFTANTDTTGAISEPGIYTVIVTDDSTGCSSICTKTLYYRIVCQIAGATSICLGQTVNFSASGGTQYSWSGPNGFTASTDTTGHVSTPGRYAVTITDDFGCSDSCFVDLTVNVIPDCIVTGDDTICFGQTTVFETLGGANYLWSGPNGFTSDSSNTGNIGLEGTYYVDVVDTNGCMTSCSRTLVVNPLPVCNIEGDSSICLDAFAAFTASGGEAYAWSGPNGFSVNTDTTGDINVAGVYSVTVTDSNSCESSCERALVLNPISNISGDQVICFGEATSFTASGGISYVWTGPGFSAITDTTGAVSEPGDYIVTVTDGNGCVGYDTITLTVNSLPICSIDGDTIICSNQTSTFTASGGTSYSWSGPAGFAPTNINPIIITIAGIYSVTVTDSNGCQSSCSRTLHVNQVPVCSIDGDSSLCLGEITSFSASGGESYSWSGPGFSASTANTGTISEAGLYNVTVTDSNGCQSSCSRTLDVHDLPTCAIADGPGGNDTICSGLTPNTWIASGAGAGGTYAWSPATGLSATDIANPSVSPTATIQTNFTYTVSVTTAFGCTTTPCSRTLTVKPLPVCNIIGGSDTVCVGGTTTWSATGGPTYSWSKVGGGFSSPNSSITFSNAATSMSGTYQVTINHFQTGCSSTCSRTLTVISPPSGSISGGVTTLCTGQTTTWTAPSAGPGATYNWSGPTGSFTFNPTSPTINITATTSGTYSVTVSNASGCNNTNPITRGLTVNPLPICSLNGTVSICAGTSTTFTASTTTSGQNYLWSGPNGFTSTSRTPTVNIAGLYSVTVTNNSTGCQSLCSQTLVVNPLPSGGITGPSTVCPGQVTTFTAFGGSTYAWSGTAPFYQASAASINTGNIGTYTVTVTSSFGCSSTYTKSLNITPNPIITVDGISPVCASAGTSVFTAQGGVYYSWIGPTGFLPTTDNPITVSIPGTYLVTGYDSNFCQGLSGKVFIINPNPNCNITGPTVICEGDTALLTASGGSSYLWTGPAGFTSTTANPIKTTIPGIYEVVITLNGCSNASACTHEITVNPRPVCSITGDSMICANETSTFTAYGGTTYLWAGPAGFDTTTSNPITINISGTYFVTATDANGCTSTCSKDLSVNPIPICSIEGDSLICEGETTIFTAFGGSTYQWTGPAGFTTTNDNPITASIAGTYYVLVTDANGCSTNCCSIELVLDPVSVTNINVNICNGDCFTAGGSCQTVSGNYYDTLVAANGCDSIVVTHLLVNPLYATQNNVTICEFACYNAGGACQTAEGTYYDTLQSIAGCDSIVITNLSISNIYVIHVNKEICEGESYYAGGSLQTEPDIYYDTLRASNGCDSIVATQLSVLPHSNSTVNVTICNNECYTAGGGCQASPGTYYDTLLSASGCDSVITTNINVLPRSFTNLGVIICNNDCYTAGGACQTSSGIYYDTLTATNGCDSIVITNLTVNPTYVTSHQVVICFGTCYDAGGACQTDAGIYYDTLQTVHGCDSVVVTELIVSDIYLTKLNQDICDGDSFFVAGAYRKLAGDYYDSLIAVNGCDSIIRTHLTVLSPSFELVEVTICDNECYTAGGACQNTQGFYYDTLLSANGCDSIVTTELEVLQRSYTTLAVGICQDDCYAAGGNCQTQSGTYYDTLPAANGCDSIVSIILTVNPAYVKSNPVTICEIACYNAGGGCQNTPGTYYDTLQTIHGCDSIIVTELSVRSVYVTDIYASICEGQILHAGGGNQTAAGIYYDTLAAANGCDSVIATHLAILSKSSSTVNVSICFGECHNAGGACQTASGNYYDTLSSASGCDSVVTTTLLVYNSCNDNNVCTDDFCDPSSGCSHQSRTCASVECNTVSCDPVLGCIYTPIPNCGQPCALAITSLTLVNSSNEQDIRTLNDVDTINLFYTPNVNIRANPCSAVGSVRFYFGNTLSRNENTAPYALAGDNNGNYNNWNVAVGLYTLNVRAFSGINGGGTAGPIKTASIRVINQQIIQPACTTAGQCNDGNPCTIDACQSGQCVHTPMVCNDNNACTTDQCVNGTCVYSTITCNDNNPCTTDNCNTTTGCVFAPLDCNDNNACTTDNCTGAGTCQHLSVNCNDNNPCTIDACNPSTGCTHTPAGGNCCSSDADCNDNDPCTIDVCSNNTCVHTPTTGSPSYLQVINVAQSWKKLKLGYDPNNIWSPSQNVSAGGNNQMCITMRAIGATAPQWNKMQIRPGGSSSSAVTLSNYVPSNPGNNWFTICIPMNAFSGFNFASFSYIEIPYSNGANAFEIHIQKIIFSGGSTPFLWFGDTHTNNKHDGGSSGALLGTVVQGTPCGSAKTSGGEINSDQLPEESAGMHLNAYPNPFKDEVTIEFSLPKSERVLVQMMDMDGRTLEILYDATVERNELYQVEFRSGSLPSGMYFYRMITESGIIENRKLMLLK